MKKPSSITKTLWDKMSTTQQQAYVDCLPLFRDELKNHGGIGIAQRATIAHNHAYLAAVTLLPNKKVQKKIFSWRDMRSLCS